MEVYGCHSVPSCSGTDGLRCSFEVCANPDILITSLQHSNVTNPQVR